MKKKYKKALSFIGEEAFYMGEKGVIEKVKLITGMIIAYLDNGMVINFVLLKNKKGEYFEDMFNEEEVKKNEEEKV